MPMNSGMATVLVLSPDGLALFIRYELAASSLKGPWLFIVVCELKLCGIHLVMQPLHPPNNLTSRQIKFEYNFLGDLNHRPLELEASILYTQPHRHSCFQVFIAIIFKCRKKYKIVWIFLQTHSWNPSFPWYKPHHDKA